MIHTASDVEVRTRRERVSKLLRHVCEDAEFPSFVSDEATLFDVCSADADEITARITEAYGQRVSADELHPPVWKLADRLEPGTKS